MLSLRGGARGRGNRVTAASIGNVAIAMPITIVVLSDDSNISQSADALAGNNRLRFSMG
jgi:hypothetical protein